MRTKYTIIAIFMLVSLMYSLSPAIAAENVDPTKPLELSDEGTHKVLVRASQWELTAYDMVQVEKLIASGTPEEKAYEQSEYKHRIGSFNKNTEVELSVVTKDVQHGFSINELDIQIATIRPEPGEEYGKATVTTFTTPNEDVTYSGYCQIFCGLGHPDMKLKFVIGEGSTDYGKFVYGGAIAANVLIFMYALYSFTVKFGKEDDVVTA